jgi:aspartyl protease family protein
MTLAQKHVLALLIWCVLLGVAYLVLNSQLKPKVALVSAGSSEVSIPRSRDGHFYVAGEINGRAVEFMVDTGASSVAVSTDVARRLGLPRGDSIRVETAGGAVMGEQVAVREVALGGMVIPHVRVLVLPGMATDALLGQNVLRYLEVRQVDGRMLLRAKEGT